MFKQSIPYITALVILGILYWIWGYPALQKRSEAEDELEKKLSKLDRLYSSPQGPPSPAIITAIEKGNEKLEAVHTKVREKLPVKEDISLPEQKNLPLYYLDQLQTLKDDLESKARKTGFKILVGDLGLPEGLPSVEDAPDLIKRLHTAKMIVDLLVQIGIASGLESMDNIKIGESKDSRENDLYEEIPISLRVSCSTLSFIKLLSTLENSYGEFFIIKSFNLVSKQEIKEIPIEETKTPVSEVEREPIVREEIPQMMETGTGLFSPEKDTIETERVVEEKIEADLALSIIRWKKL
ncbi:MAG TPA: hypothetical protein EYP78_03475 [Candidatus Omnitrophica bacterium]|nr:hypothetical protein [Candidatus Omnitrophota bacterium]